MPCRSYAALLAFSLANAAVAGSIGPQQADAGQPPMQREMARYSKNDVALEPLSQALENASWFARGSKICDDALSARQKARFEKLYALRIERLKKAYFAWHGPDPDAIVLSYCLPSSNKGLRPAALNRALRDFDGRLRYFEANYAAPPRSRGASP